MHIVLFTHPDFTASHSMRLYAKLIKEGMQLRGHTVEEQTAEAFFSKVKLPGLRKWLGYADQFLIFPIDLKLKLSNWSDETLFVFADHALGPWVPLVKRKPHVVHCHDFIAQKSALAELTENKLSRTGIWYQKLIRRGYSKAKNFISISRATQTDLHRFLKEKPCISEVVYNGLNQDFKPGDTTQVCNFLSKKYQIDLNQGYIFHIGSNTFYKNREGVLAIYDVWRGQTRLQLPLILVGEAPNDELKKLREQSSYAADIHFLTGVEDAYLQMFYQGARLLLFPSLEEGFGWPIAEAQACGCPVLTTAKSPMTEVGGDAAFYIPRLNKKESVSLWASKAAAEVEKVIALADTDLQAIEAAGLENAKRFNTQNTLDAIELIYKRILLNHGS